MLDRVLSLMRELASPDHPHHCHPKDVFANIAFLLDTIYDGNVQLTKQVFAFCLDFKFDLNTNDVRLESENIIRAAVLSGNPSLLLFIRKECLRLNLDITPETKNDRGEDAFSEISKYSKHRDLIVRILKASPKELDEIEKSMTAQQSIGSRRGLLR